MRETLIKILSSNYSTSTEMTDLGVTTTVQSCLMRISSQTSTISPLRNDFNLRVGEILGIKS
jgi:hypothetical protein